MSWSCTVVNGLCTGFQHVMGMAASINAVFV